jgi:uncharacterized protein YuzE
MGAATMTRLRTLAALAVATTIAIVTGTGVAALPQAPHLIFGSPGDRTGEFNGAVRLDVDADGRIYVVDSWNDRIQVFDASGAFVFTFGTSGSGPGELSRPSDVAVARDGSIYVADDGNLRVQKFSRTGAHIRSFGSEGREPGQFFNHVMSLAVDKDGDVYVGSVFALQKFGPDGDLRHVFPLGGVLPVALDIDPAGNIVMFEKDWGAVEKRDPTGKLLFRFARSGCDLLASPTPYNCTRKAPGAIELGDGELGLGGAGGLEVDALGNIYVADSRNYRIQMFNPEGRFLWKFGGPGDKAGEFGESDGPRGLAVDLSLQVYIADSDNSRVQVLGHDRSLSVGNELVLEGDDGTVEMTFTVTLSVPSGAPVTVDYATADGTASAGEDYTAASGSLLFAPGERIKTVTVLVASDTSGEPDETFRFSLSNPSGAPLLGAESTGTIANDDDGDGSGDDTTPPAVAYTLDPPPNAAGWNNSPVQVSWTFADPDSDVTSSSGCEPQTFVADPTDVTMTCSVTNGAGLITTVTASVRIDRTAPSITCGAPDGAWHATDVAIRCAAIDAVSGLADPQPQFTLATAVPAGTETISAATGSTVIFDLAGNAATAGPVTGIKVDKKGPTISIELPQAGANFVIDQTTSARYVCDDNGALLASCTGPVAQGSLWWPQTAGTFQFEVVATDRVGNRSTASVTYTASYAVCLLYDPSAALRIGPIVPILVSMCNASGRNVSWPDISLRAVELVNLTTGATMSPRSPLPPYDAFIYLGWPGRPGAYGYPLVTSGLQPGQYELRFKAGNDPKVHAARFVLR